MWLVITIITIMIIILTIYVVSEYLAATKVEKKLKAREEEMITMLVLLQLKLEFKEAVFPLIQGKSRAEAEAIITAEARNWARIYDREMWDPNEFHFSENTCPEKIDQQNSLALVMQNGKVQGLEWCDS